MKLVKSGNLEHRVLENNEDSEVIKTIKLEFNFGLLKVSRTVEKFKNKDCLL